MLFDMDMIFFPMKLGIYLVANFLAASKMLCTMYHYLANLENKFQHIYLISSREFKSKKVPRGINNNTVTVTP